MYLKVAHENRSKEREMTHRVFQLSLLYSRLVKSSRALKLILLPCGETPTSFPGERTMLVPENMLHTILPEKAMLEGKRLAHTRPYILGTIPEPGVPVVRVTAAPAVLALDWLAKMTAWTVRKGEDRFRGCGRKAFLLLCTRQFNRQMLLLLPAFGVFSSVNERCQVQVRPSI